MVGAETKSSKERQKERKNSLEISGYSGLHHQRNVWTNLDGILLLSHPTFKDLPTLSHSLLPPCHLITCTQPFPARHSSIQPGLRYLSNCCVAAPPGQFHHCGRVFTSVPTWGGTVYTTQSPCYILVGGALDLEPSN